MSDRGSIIYHTLADPFLAVINMVTPSHAAIAPAVHFTYPSSHLFQVPPAQEPSTLSPPISDHTFARPFSIDPSLYNNALHVAVPISVALVYAALVTLLNRVNKRREHQPWAWSKSLAFYAFVLTHNVVLALYSAWTFLGMLNAFRQSWPGLNGQYGVVGAVDALCKIHGPRGLGSAATYDPNASRWGVTDRLVQLLEGAPDATDVGRIWNEGLAFYGWLFYISKFYEITDTFIVLAKGKRSSILQTYHHAGAMMCMWAGIRYMSPPIWMFVFINSGLHAAMYTYYALGTLSISVPRILKQTLTTLQIVQFVFGAFYAVIHLFIAYSIPVSSPYLFVHNLSTAVPSIASSVSSVVSTATVTAGLGSWLKKAALRAAGEEGLAENVRNSRGEPFGIDAVHAAQVEKAQKEIRYKTQYETVHCLDTQGQVFAILLNALYLAPLTWLFINFFIQSYSRRVRSASAAPDRKSIAKESSKDALHNLEKEIEDALAEQDEGNQADLPPEIQENLDRARANLKHQADDISSKTKKSAQDANDAISRTAKTVKIEAGKQVQNAKDAVTSQVENAKAVTSDAVEAFEQRRKEAREAFEQRTKEAKEAFEKRTKDAREAFEQRSKDAKEAWERRSKDAIEGYEKRKNESVEAYEKRRNEGIEAYEKRKNEGIEAYEKRIEAYEKRKNESVEAYEKRKNEGIEAYEKRKNEGIEAYEKRKNAAIEKIEQEKAEAAKAGKTGDDSGEQANVGNDGFTKDGHDEDSIVESIEDADEPTNGEDVIKPDEVESVEAAEPEDADHDTQPEKNEESPAPEGKTAPEADSEAEKADAEWDPEDGRDPEAEAYEVQIDEMLNASEKRAEQELLPDNLS